MKNQYKYDAFISYRHKELDKFVAENLHKQMESFKLPGNVSRKHKGGRTKIERVFRDKEELPISSNLEDPIMQALQNSEYLVVICTPRIRESIWCRKEITTFIEMHGRNKVLAVLAEGEPADSFPEELLYKDVTVTNEDGTTSVIREPVEPLAADVRGKNNKEVLKAIKAELPRLLAPMFDMTYDDLKQRHRERRMKKILAASLTVAGVCLAFGAVSTVMALQINNQKNQIEEKNMEIVAQNAQITAQAAEIQSQNEEISKQNDALAYNQALNLADEADRKLENGDRIGAVQTAMEALTQSNGVTMPYTENAQYALNSALRAYRKCSSFLPDFQIETVGVVNEVVISPDKTKAFIADSANMASLYDLNTAKLLKRLDNVSYSSNLAAFINNEEIAYVTDSYTIHIYNMVNDSEISVGEEESLGRLLTDGSGKYLAVSNTDHGYVLNAQTKDKVFTFEAQKDTIEGLLSLNCGENDYLIYKTCVDFEENYTLHICNVTTGEKREVPLGSLSPQYVCCEDATAYVALCDFGNYVDNFSCEVRSYDLQTGKVNWTYTLPEAVPTSLTMGEGEFPSLLLGLSFDGVILDRRTGKENGMVSMASAIAEVFAFPETNFFGVFSMDGKFHQVNAETCEDIVSLDFFVSHSNSIRFAKWVSGGFLVGSYPENRMVRYSLFEMDTEPEKDMVDRTDTEELFGQEMKDYVNAHGYENPKLVGTVFFNEDQSLTFVYYRDQTLRIYDEQDNLLNTLSDIDTDLDTYFGKDKEGNYFIGNTVRAYMISPNHKVLAQLYYLVAVDAEKGEVILEDTYTRKQYRYPIYSKEDLIAMGQELVLKYTD